MNLRGVKESGTVFSVPTYGFVVCIMGLLLKGLWNVATGQAVVVHTAAVQWKAPPSWPPSGCWRGPTAPAARP